MTESTPVAISGGGPVGLACALALAREGVRSIVLEKSIAPAQYARAGVLLSRTLEIFRSWEIVDDVRAAGISPDVLRVCDASDERILAEINFSLLRGRTPEPGPIFLPQQETEALLREHVLRSGHAELRFGHEVTDLAQLADGVNVRVQPNGGDVYEIRAEYLVGADGAASTVRAALGLKLLGETYETRVMLALVRVDGCDGLPWPRFRFDVPEYLVALRAAPRLWRIVATLPGAESEEIALGRDAIARYVRLTLGDEPFDVEWASAYSIHRRHAAKFASGRVALAGDAAHLNSPVGGQGLNAGIADAKALAATLVRALRDGDGETLLAGYDLERRTAIVKTTEAYTDRATKFVLAVPRSWRKPLFIAAGVLLRFKPLARRLIARAMMLD
jgi:2-polyprenyl-6-methoxyphenol hydroxylase-like FAD-dependent oxidoreductase